MQNKAAQRLSVNKNKAHSASWTQINTDSGVKTFVFLSINPQGTNKITKAPVCDHREVVNVKMCRVIHQLPVLEGRSAGGLEPRSRLNRIGDEYQTQVMHFESQLKKQVYKPS